MCAEIQIPTFMLSKIFYFELYLKNDIPGDTMSKRNHIHRIFLERKKIYAESVYSYLLQLSFHESEIEGGPIYKTLIKMLSS